MVNFTSEKNIDPRYKIGMRNVKTAASVGICLLFFQLIGVSDGIQAAIAAIICMKSSLQNSIQTGIERIVGTFIGAILGILSLMLIGKTSFHIYTILAIAGVIIIIYLCNILKIQASIVIGLVVFLIILLGEKDLPPLEYGTLRLLETFFGIIVAYLINRFIDPRHLRRFTKADANVSPSIREGGYGDLPQIMSIWLQSNIDTHRFIDPYYWHKKYDAVRSNYHYSASVYVYDQGSQIYGFISVQDDMEIVGLNVINNMKNEGITEQLILYCQEIFPCLSIKVFLINEKLVETLAKSGFTITNEVVDTETQIDQYIMSWSDKSDTASNI